MFWSLSVHRYQTQSLLITIFATTGHRMTLVIDRNPIDEKKIENFDQIICYVPQKKKAKNM